MKARYEKLDQSTPALAPLRGSDPYQILANVSKVFAEATLDARTTIQSVCGLIVETLGEAALVRLLSDDGEWLVPVAVEHVEPEVRVRAEETLSVARHHKTEGLSGQVIAEGRARQFFAEEIPSLLGDEMRAQFQQCHDVQCILVAPLRVQGKVIGTLVLSRHHGRPPFSDEEQILIQEIADRAALAIEVSRLITAKNQSEERSRTYVVEQKALIDRLEETQKRVDDMEEGARAGLWHWDVASDRVHWSSGYKRLLGLAPHAAGDDIGSWADRLHPADKAGFWNRLHESLEGEGTELLAEYRLRCETGQYRWFVCRGRIRRGDDGLAASVSGAVFDISRRKELEETMRRGEQRLSAVFSQAVVGIVQVDRNGTFVLVNDKFCEIVGRSREELVRLGALDITHADDRAMSDDRFQRLVDSGENYLIEKRYVRPDGEIVWVFNSISALRDSTGFVWGGVAITLDVSEKKRSELALRESEERMRIALGAARMVAWDLDIATNRIARSANAEEILGTMCPEPDAFFARIHADDRQRVRDAFSKAIAGVASYEIEYGFLRDDGISLWLCDKASVGRDATGKAVRLTGVLLDITERRMREEEIRRQAADLERSNADLVRFAYVASHDLKEPIRMVSNYAQVFERAYLGRLDANADMYLRFIREGVQRMYGLIDDLLRYSRIGGRPDEWQRVDSGTVVAEAISNLSVAIAESGAEVRVGSLPLLVADPVQLLQVFQNLIGNALKYRCKEGTPRVEVTCVADEGLWRFSVADNGIGIESAFHGKIFELFQRLHPKDEYGGTGLGLAICQRVVERMGGSIWVESALDKGATFLFTLPQHAAAPVARPLGAVFESRAAV